MCDCCQKSDAGSEKGDPGDRGEQPRVVCQANATTKLERSNPGGHRGEGHEDPGAEPGVGGAEVRNPQPECLRLMMWTPKQGCEERPEPSAGVA